MSINKIVTNTKVEEADREFNQIFKPGNTAFYHCGETTAEVKVLEAHSDKRWIKYKLEVLSVIEGGSQYLKPEMIFEPTKGKNIGAYPGLWYLSDRC